ncbi:hypothetical protein L1987_44140 [Smallanthus sonchifolius]|uniref:Uncharacterized protein n=1 Tax=Smallanthus sonchifolius TaxID=185202 RepID=A0ACB9GP96_9ASTR|nr:hypothetical protein L1987_44140 [Smallanthus sonchifolius]
MKNLRLRGEMEVRRGGFGMGDYREMFVDNNNIDTDTGEESHKDEDYEPGLDDQSTLESNEIKDMLAKYNESLTNSVDLKQEENIGTASNTVISKQEAMDANV